MPDAPRHDEKLPLPPPPTAQPPPLSSSIHLGNGYHADDDIRSSTIKVEQTSSLSPSSSSMRMAPPSAPSSVPPRPPSPAQQDAVKVESSGVDSLAPSSSSSSSSRSPSASSSSADASSSSSSPKKHSINGGSTSRVPTEHKLTQVATSLPPKSRKKKSASSTAILDAPPQIIDHLPEANDEALSTFTRLADNWYANKHIGRSKGHEWGLVCECNYRPGRDDISRACTDEGGCINRLTQVECVAEDCRCGQDCQNQRFQRKQYADVDVVKTEKKGFGLRAKAFIPADTFVYEYIGEVVEEHDFRKRMQRYHDERVPHFYFMMLQRDEYLDATKKGGIARFINHSCNPNCFVAKWHVGKHMRMGIFSQRDIVKGEELTFNYNVDRYGNEAQPCYCGEPNCVGQLGGKTQTDIGGMSNLYIEALGIVDEVEHLQARGSRKQKSRTLDEDFNPTLRPMEEDEVSTVATAIRQAASSNRSVLSKLLARIDMTDDVAVQKRFVRLHGFVLMSGVLTEWRDDREIVLLCIRILAKWPLIARNKVVDTGVEGLVQEFKKSEDAEIQELAGQLYDAWQQLSLEFRIARKEEGDDNGAAGVEDEEMTAADGLRSRRRRDDEDEASQAIQDRMDYALDHAQAPNDVSAALEKAVPRPLGTAPSTPIGVPRFGRPPPGRPLAPGWGARLPPRSSLGNGVTPGTPQTPADEAGPSTPASQSQPTMSIEEIIRRANEAQEAERKRVEEEAAREAEERRKEAERAPLIGSSKSKGKHRERDKDRASRKRHRSSKSGATSETGTTTNGSSSSHPHPSGDEQDEQHKRHKSDDRDSPHKSSGSASSRSLDKRLHILISEIVIRHLSKEKARFNLTLDRDSFKRHAKDMTDMVCEKEKKSAREKGEAIEVAEKLGPDKEAKVKTFVRGYVEKLVRRREEKERAAASGGTASTPSESTKTTAPIAGAHSSSTTGTPSSSSTATSRTTAVTSVGGAADEQTSSKGLPPPGPPPGPPPPRPGSIPES
ncbi:hypothetical protein BDZ90DRAFT_267210 [Jaminaea rosea]|uniref:Histone-lysine N-methyltransferase, H3 lysine-36 specific n=1 Tax=Jaminaea rosea TaxID=1569628 RepID=A0A316UMJ8_9BASI|nr:hypothetical protein BDZ90DRAFT_267210 [Jaminaea rosea]PWN26184.1 hypothetical protein BDZ90DRAFT_267210 [Jaminaea rosea]